MKFTGIFIAFIALFFAACTAKEEIPQPATQSTSKGDLRITLKMYTSYGPAASSALVNIASSADSLASGEYITTMGADDFGYALFKDISWKKNPTHKIYFNASQKDGNDTLRGSGSATLQENRTVNAPLVLQ